jgi:hypothetical protein
MNRSTKKSIGARVLLVLALGAAAVLALAGVASAKDRNHDRIPDRWEHRNHLSLQVNQAGRDQDHDGLRNLAEFRTGNDPRNNDSDNDGIDDGEEGAGTITSFDATSGKLVINLFGGETLSGTVTATTKIKCENEHSEGSSVSALSGEPEPGDENGGQGNQPGDDNGGNSGSGSSSSGQSGHDDNNGGNGNGANCTTADLTVGAVVSEAHLEASNGSTTFDEVELAG